MGIALADRLVFIAFRLVAALATVKGFFLGVLPTISL